MIFIVKLNIKMFPRRIIKQLVKDVSVKDAKKIVYTYSGFSFPIKKDGSTKQPPKSIHEYQAYH